MATIKSYTDIEQSHKLAEILPLESTDGHWFNDSLGVNYRQKAKDFYDTTNNEYIPAWSLAALYGILPNNKKESTTLSRGGWKIEPIEYLDNWWCEYEDESHAKDFTVSAGNPVDACYEMIIKLNELNLL